LISKPVAQSGQHPPHGITSFLEILAYLKYIERRPERDLEQNIRWARETLGWKELHPFENSIALIASGSLTIPLSEIPEDEKIALQTCNPPWFVKQTIQVFGRAFALRMLGHSLKLLPVYVRINTLKNHQEDRAEKIAARLRAERLVQLQDVLKIDKAGSALARSDLYQSGEIVIQDLASIVTGCVSSPKQGSVVLDLCAAPGNKTSHLAASMNNRGEIYSVDISEKRLSHWKREMSRTGVTVASPIQADAKTISTNVKADVVLVDPPCSNTGVFARNPDIKWRITAQRIRELAVSQHDILKAAAECVSSNGTLIYCTCSILPEENELLIEDFLKRHHDFKLVPQTPFLGSHGLRGMKLCQRFYPHIHDCNGYFIAKLQKID
jgi:16S rRNA (cytosine967-C5)-methyltransferase